MTATSFTSATPATRLQGYLRSIEALLRAGETLRASRIASEAVEKGCEHANLYTLAALDSLHRGNSERTLALASKARALAPRNAEVLNMLGMALVASGRPRDALAVYDEALRQAPGLAHIRLNRGQALESLNDARRARADYQRALTLKPDYVPAMARLAALAGLGGDVADARRYGERVLAQEPHNEAALLALAMAGIEEGEFEQALARTAPLLANPNPTPLNLAIAQGLRADALDGLSRTADAFAAYRQSNATMQQTYRASFRAAGRETAMERIERLIRYFRAAGPEWAAKAPSYKSPVETHAFLLGFLRSGATLIERALDAHPDIAAMPERDCLADAASELTGSDEALNALAALDGENLARFRARYWNRVAENWHSPAQRIFVDKLPLSTVSLCLIAKLFPDAKILFAVRDPRDVALSCFRRRFAMTAETYELLDLENAALYYDKAMQLASLYRERLPLDLREIRYEAAVENFEGEMRETCAFLGADWNDAILDFAQTPPVKDIATPSAPQVARGLYEHGAGQWRRYRAQMEPALPLLAHWVEHFGYREN